MLKAETRFRKVVGYRGLAGLAVKIEHDLLRNRQLDSYTSTEEDMAGLCNHLHAERRPSEFPRRTGQPRRRFWRSRYRYSGQTRQRPPFQ
jgi:hypothetical protein